MKKYTIATQFSGFFVYYFYREILLSDQCEKIFFLQQSKQRKLFLYDLYKVFGMADFIKLIMYEIFFRFKYFLIDYSKLKAKVLYINNISELYFKNSDYFISIGFPRILSQSDLNVPNVNFLNLHGGILPYQRGLFSPYWAIKYKDKYIGATLHKMDAQIDCGEIISSIATKLESTNVLNAYINVLAIGNLILTSYLNDDKKYVFTKVSESDFTIRGPQGYPG